MPDLSARIADIELPCCLYNASGARCMLANELDAIGQSTAGAILSKSCTRRKRAGNPEPRYVETGWGSINSMGLPNEGLQYYISYAQQAATYAKPYIISVSGLSFDENCYLMQQLAEAEGVTAVELNLSCPNVPGKPQTAYDFAQTDRLLAAVAPLMQDKRRWGVKLPPYFDIIHFEQMAALLNQYPISFVTCINSIGNGLVIDPETECVLIRPKNGLGGIGGDYIKPTALANVRLFYTLLNPSISVIGCGGVRSGTDAFEHILCGAAAVQIGSTLAREGTACFGRIAGELQAIMRHKGYASIADFRGKLKLL